jgi:type II secretory pathway predicted ATPase ExeA
MMKTPVLGFNDTINSVVLDIESYFKEAENGPYLCMIKGQIGAGKTVFARNLIEELHNVPEFSEYLKNNRKQLPVFTSMVDAERELTYLAAWRPIL